MSAPQIDLERALGTAIEAVEAASRAELAWFRKGVVVETKADRSPVTAADREAEAAILAILRRDWPDHGFLGEESGASGNEGDFLWVVDPLDGTKGFTRGGAFWGPLVALLHRGRALAGVMALPVSGDVYAAARGLGCTKNGARLAVSKIDRWADATLSLGELQHLFRLRQRGVLELIDTAKSARCYGDLAGAALVLEGRADAWVEAGVQLWDLAPIQVLVEEAGGRFSDLAGAETLSSGSALVSNGLLHSHLLSVLGGTP